KMTETIKKLEQLLQTGTAYIATSLESDLTYKSIPEKWSKKEILGHLVDSGINNLQRFTEIQFSHKPYKVRKYNQDELVRVNDYQYSDMKEIVALWNSIHNRILFLMKRQTVETLNNKIELEEGKISDF